MRIRFVSRLRARCRACGFTLVELMVTIAIAAILLMIAVPSFKRLILSNRLTTTANAMVDALNIARMDAIKLNATTQFCGSTSAFNNTDISLGTACGTTAGAVYSQPQSAATAGQVRAAPAVTAPMQLGNISGAAAVQAVRFSGRGFGYKPTLTPDSPFGGNVAVICTTQLSSNNQRIVSMTAGSIVAVATSTGSCP